MLNALDVSTNINQFAFENKTLNVTVQVIPPGCIEIVKGKRQVRHEILGPPQLRMIIPDPIMTWLPSQGCSAYGRSQNDDG